MKTALVFVEGVQVVKSAASGVEPKGTSAQEAPAGPNTGLTPQSIHADALRRARLKPDAEGSLVYHGATSIFNNDLLSTSENFQNPTQSLYAESNFEHVMDHFGIRLSDDAVLNALKQFFRWHYICRTRLLYIHVTNAHFHH